MPPGGNVNQTALHLAAPEPRDVALQNMATGVIVVDAGGDIMLCNAAIPRLFRISSASVPIGMPFHGFLRALAPVVGWDEARTVRIIDNHRLWMTRSEPTAVRHHFDNGSVLSIVCRPLADGGAVLTYDDVTEAVVHARESRKHETRAEDSERSFRLLVKGITDYAIYMLNPDGTVANWNAGAQRAKGYTEDEIVGRHYRVFYDVADQAAGVPDRNLATALREGRFEDEGPRYRKDGTSFLAHVVIDPIFEEDGSLLGFAKITRDRTEHFHNAERIAHMARHDALTGLPNRVQFVERLDDAIGALAGAGGKVALVNIDLDGFKQINDTHGHAVGDTVLKTLAQRMTADLREGEIIGRFGGDEFVALKSYRHAGELEAFIARTQGALSESIDLQHCNLVLGASFGVANFPADADSREKLMSNADLAMYRAKAALIEKVCFYEASMDEAEREKRKLAADLWRALEHGDQFYLDYQEQRSVSGQEIIGYEALLRWRHPERGLISPVRFIPIAESCGAIVALGDWVLETACREAARRGLTRIAVNLSPLQLGNVSLIGKVRETLTRTGLAPHCLELEITETAVINDRERALHILRQIKAMGVAIAIDDFGTGFSSLETLRLFPFDRIKLDRSFTTDLEHDGKAQAFVKAILMLGASLQMAVLAEGVERETQMAFLAGAGCGEVQGFLFGRPRSLEHLTIQAESCG
nr:EAL domain-containing protein [Aureimonas mangrovi]